MSYAAQTRFQRFILQLEVRFQLKHGRFHQHRPDFPPISFILSPLSDPPSPPSFVLSFQAGFLLPKYSCGSPPVCVRGGPGSVCLPHFRYLWTFFAVSRCRNTRLHAHLPPSRTDTTVCLSLAEQIKAGCSYWQDVPALLSSTWHMQGEAYLNRSNLVLTANLRHRSHAYGGGKGELR